MQKREFLKSGLAALGGLGFLGAARAGEPAVTKASDVRWDEEWDTVIVGSGVLSLTVPTRGNPCSAWGYAPFFIVPNLL